MARRGQRAITLPNAFAGVWPAVHPSPAALLQIPKGISREEELCERV